MKIVLLLCSVLAATKAGTFSELLGQEWKLFKVQHSKVYSSPIEEQQRLRTYMENRKMIAEHNARYARGEVTFKMDMNQFGDMSHEEVLTRMGLTNQTRLLSGRRGETYVSQANVQADNHVDWVREGAVTDVKNQGLCGSCWSFSATGAIEAQHFFKTEHLVPLSEQNLIDCTVKYGNHGCSGGWMDNAFSYVIENGGIDKEASYPYEAKIGECRYNSDQSGATISKYFDLQVGNEGHLKEAVFLAGPVSVTLDASKSSFHFYSKGIYYEPECSTDKPNHAVLVVGYGTEEDSDYWYVKNSWGTKWGEDGFFKIARNKHNHCGIASHASYPIL